MSQPAIDASNTTEMITSHPIETGQDYRSVTDAITLDFYQIYRISSHFFGLVSRHKTTHSVNLHIGSITLQT